MVVLEEGVVKTDIKVDEETGTIATLGSFSVSPEEEGKTWVNAENLHVFPGGIDVHVHFRDPGKTHKEDFFTGSQAALAGGITTVLDMPNNDPPITSREALEEKRNIVRQKALCDYGLFFGATNSNWEEAARSNALALKIFMGESTGNWCVDSFSSLVKHFTHFPRLIALHPEDARCIARMGRILKSELVAIEKALRAASYLHRPIHLCHVTSLKSLTLIDDAKRKGTLVTCEVTPHHLFLNQNDLQKNAFLHVYPPLRSEHEQRVLLAHMERADVFASDHAPHTREEKSSARPPAGIPGVEFMFPLFLDLVAKGRLSPLDLARRLCFNPARIFNIRRKGFIKPGYDADVVLVDLQEQYRLTRVWSKCGWSPYVGRTVWGKIKKVYLRGKLVFDGEQVLASPGFGKEVEPCTPPFCW